MHAILKKHACFSKKPRQQICDLIKGALEIKLKDKKIFFYKHNEGTD